MRISLNTRPSVLDEVQALRREIATRAFEIFEGRGATDGQDLDDWLAAERQTLWKPAVEVIEKDGAFVIEAALAGAAARQIDVQVSPDELLIRGQIDHRHHPEERVHRCEFQSGRLFRAVAFPRRIDPQRVKADYRDGLLRVWAPAADTPAARKPKARRVPIASR